MGRALGYLGIGIDTSIASADEVDNAVRNQDEAPTENENKKWLTESQFAATLKATKDQAENVLNSFKMKKSIEKNNRKV